MESGACLRLLISLVLALCMAEEASCWSSAEKPGTIYDALKMNGLPIGLLPKNVKNYTIDEEWSFEVHLDEPCYAKFENQVCYDTNIKGTISYGQIGNLSGIVAQDLFLWFPVKGIHVDVPSSGLIYFDVGVVYKQFSLSLFENPPDCKPKADRRAEAELMEGKMISDMLSKTLSGKLRFESDNPPTKAIQ
ncbi:uncharacterized protein LOC131032835 isoform X2 [Cryptomeria japonica]|uniref:uncharacterized protein LOC131032835 isoform X2 n=1 Tax=Cryptomeria japonica TaxID=3369 RepID=UPI0025AD1F3C|nr:uncharacterized protein LOC131032835 isoform X2 [Cryptomeria japonica]